MHNRALLIFAGAVLSYQFANAAALPTKAGLLAKRMPEMATVILSICIFAPQLVVAVIAPWVGRQAQNWGRRPLLVLNFTLPTSFCSTNQKSSVAIFSGKPIPRPDRFLSRDKSLKSDHGTFPDD